MKRTGFGSIFAAAFFTPGLSCLGFFAFFVYLVFFFFIFFKLQSGVSFDSLLMSL